MGGDKTLRGQIPWLFAGRWALPHTDGQGYAAAKMAGARPSQFRNRHRWLVGPSEIKVLRVN